MAFYKHVVVFKQDCFYKGNNTNSNITYSISAGAPYQLISLMPKPQWNFF